MAVVTFHLPDLGEGLTEAEIVEWHVEAGDVVTSGQPLLSVETDKALVDIPAPRTATIAAVHGAPGDLVAVGAPLVDFQVATADAGAVVGTLDEQADAAEAAPASSPSPSAAAKRVRAAPKARRRARELGLELATIAPAGSIIQVADVEAAAEVSARAPAAAPRALRGVRRAMAARMADAHARVVPASVTDEANISAWGAGQRPLPRVVRALARGASREPKLNAHFDDEALQLIPQASVDVGIAMETTDGLFVPVLRDAARLSLEAIAAELTALEHSVQARSLSVDALRGQTISLSNFGSVAGLHAQMVVVPPQVAIIGVGRIFERLTIAQGEPGNARMLPLSLTFDHRAVTGVEACRFLAALIEDLETPA